MYCKPCLIPTTSALVNFFEEFIVPDNNVFAKNCLLFSPQEIGQKLKQVQKLHFLLLELPFYQK
jgi:hypothetical protein